MPRPRGYCCWCCTVPRFVTLCPWFCALTSQLASAQQTLYESIDRARGAVEDVLAVFHTAQPRAREYLAEQLSRGQAAVEEVRSCAVCGYSKIMDGVAVWAGNAVVSVRCASAGKRCTVSVSQAFWSWWWLAAFATEAV